MTLASTSDASFYVELGQRLEREEQWTQAIAVYRKALSKNPECAQLHVAIGNLRHRQDDYHGAIEAYEIFLQAQPNAYEVWYNLGNARADAGDREQAMACHRRALAIQPDFHLALKELGVLFQQQGQIPEALERYQQALAIQPDYAEGHASLGSLYARQGRMKDAIQHYRRALELNPSLHQIHSNLLFFINFDASYDKQTVFDEYRLWNDRHARKWSDEILPRVHDFNPERKLRIGFVSPDFREHVIASYTEPLLAHADRQQFEIFCYANVRSPDETTARLKTYPVVWRDIAALSDEQVCQQIRTDGIDILIDLAGHMSDNRLLVFARKPAPLQITQLGYPNTTGLDAMDIRITDAHMDPPGLTEAFHTEKLARLPHCAFCYRPLKESPEIVPCPFLKNGYITFASLNNFAKVSDETIALWSRLLHQLPQSKLLILIQGGSRNAEAVQQRFAPHAIPLERLAFFGLRSRRAYLELHQNADICLDPFPYNGGISTFEALWMGVPVITLAGETSCARHGVSLWNNLGMPEFIAHDPDDYLRIAVSLANNPRRLQELRATLRERLRQSPMMDEAGYTRDLENLYRQLWRERCVTK